MYRYDALGPIGFLEPGRALVMPAGTVMVHDAGTWGMYYSATLNMTYLVYALNGGWNIKRMAGKRSVGRSVNAFSHLSKIRQAQSCGGCPNAIYSSL